MNLIVLTPDELMTLRDLSLTNKQQYYIWVGILALRGETLPLTYWECPKHIEGHTFQTQR